MTIRIYSYIIYSIACIPIYSCHNDTIPNSQLTDSLSWEIIPSDASTTGWIPTPPLKYDPNLNQLMKKEFNLDLTTNE